MRRRLSTCYPLQLEAIPALIMLVAFYLVASNYAALPDRMPTHFNLNGIADRWGGRGTVWVLPAVGASAYFFLAAVTLAMAAVADPLKLVNLPRKSKEKLTQAQGEELRAFTLRALLAMRLVMSCLTTYMTYQTIQVGLGRSHALGALFYVLLAAILSSAFVMAWKAVRLAATTSRR